MELLMQATAPTRTGKWTEYESEKLRDAIQIFGEKRWTDVSRYLLSKFDIKRAPTQCRHRWHKTMLPNIKKGHWDNNESELLKHLVLEQKATLAAGATVDWELIATKIQGRTGKACRERWTSRIDPSINHERFTDREEHLLMVLHSTYGNQWARIAERMPGRTADAVKSKYISIMRRRKIDPKFRSTEGTHCAYSMQQEISPARKRNLESSIEQLLSESPPKRRLSPINSDCTVQADIVPMAETFAPPYKPEVALSSDVCDVLASMETVDLNIPNRTRAHSLDLGEDTWADANEYMHVNMSPTAIARPSTMTPVKLEGADFLHSKAVSVFPHNNSCSSFLSMLQGQAVEPLMLSEDFSSRSATPEVRAATHTVTPLGARP